MRLIEIDGLNYIPRDDGIILMDLSDTIHLNGEEHGDAISFQFARQGNGFRAAPAMTVNDNVGVLFLVGCQSSIMVRVQKVEDFLRASSPRELSKVSTSTPKGYALRRRAASCTSLWAGLSCLINPPDEADDDRGRRRAGQRLASARIGSAVHGCPPKPDSESATSTDRAAVSTPCQRIWSFFVSIGSERSE